FYQLLQIREQRRIFVDVLLPSPAWFSNPANALRTACLAGMAQLFQFALSSSDRSARNTSRPRNHRDAPRPSSLGLRSSHQPSELFVENRLQCNETRRDRRLVRSPHAYIIVERATK